MAPMIRDGSKLEAFVKKPTWARNAQGEFEVPASTGHEERARGLSRPAYPGFSAKDLAARDWFALDIQSVTDKNAETIDSMLGRFDSAIRAATAMASAKPRYFEGSDRYLAQKIVEAEFATVKTLKFERDTFKARAEAQQLEAQSMRRQRNEMNTKLIEAERKLKTDARVSWQDSYRVADEDRKRLGELRVSDAKVMRDLRLENESLTSVNARLKGELSEFMDRQVFDNMRKAKKEHGGAGRSLTPSSILSGMFKSSTQKERPMSKGKIAAAIVAAAVLGPFAFNQAKGWGGVVADLTPTEMSIEDKLAELETEQRETFIAYARKYRELQDAQDEKSELEALEQEFLTAFNLSKSELEGALAVVGE